MSAAKCNICGRFRRWADVITVDYSDEHQVLLVEECKTCTPPANLNDLKPVAEMTKMPHGYVCGEHQEDK